MRRAAVLVGFATWASAGVMLGLTHPRPSVWDLGAAAVREHYLPEQILIGLAWLAGAIVWLWWSVGVVDSFRAAIAHRPPRLGAKWVAGAALEMSLMLGRALAPQASPVVRAVPASQPVSVELLATTEPAPTTKTYTVVAGDTLAQIAQREMGSKSCWRQLVAANPQVPDPIYGLQIGDVLKIPQAPARPAPGGESVVVRPGDSMWEISTELEGDGDRWPQLAAANPQVRDPSLIYPGQRLTLPSSWPEGASPKLAERPRAAPPGPARTKKVSGDAHETRPPLLRPSSVVPRESSGSAARTTGSKASSRLASIAATSHFKARHLLRPGKLSPAKHSGGNELLMEVLGGAVLLGAGAVAFGRMRRRRAGQLLAATNNTRMPPPPTTAEATGIAEALGAEMARHNRDDARVDQALGALDDALSNWPAAERPTLLAVTAGDEAVSCWFSGPTLPAPPEWEQPEPARWVHRGLDESAPHSPCGTVVSLGWVPATGDWCWADLMATPLVCLVGSRAEILARQWVFELLDARTTAGVGDLVVVGVPTVGPTCSAVAAAQRLEDESTRRANRSPWFGDSHLPPFVVVTNEVFALPLLTQGIVVIVVGEAIDGGVVIDTDANGVEIADTGLVVRLAIGRDGVLDAMETAIIATSLAESVAVPDAPEPLTRPPARPGEVPVRILGPLARITATRLSRSGFAKVLALLAYERRPLPPEVIAERLSISLATVRNAIGELRRVLGDEAVPKTSAGIALMVASDWSLFDALSAHEALALVEPDVIDGEVRGPLGDISEIWWANEGVYVVTAKVVERAKSYARECQERGDYAEARWAAEQGLKITSHDAELVEMAARAAMSMGQVDDACRLRNAHAECNPELLEAAS